MKQNWMNLPSVCLLLTMMILGNGTLFACEMEHADTAAIALDSLHVELNEVVFTATRVSQRIIDIPYPVVQLNFLNYQYDRKTGSDEILSPVPGLFLQSRYGDQDVRYSGRGFGSRSNADTRGVRILLNDIPELEPDGQSRLDALDFNSIGRVEIVKGNASSLYSNAPGGVVNFISDLDFDRSLVVQFNQFGSFGLHQNGFKAAVKAGNSKLLTTYSYLNYDGYRQHNGEYRHILNMVYEASPTAHTKLSILGYFITGASKLPGSLTKEEFTKDPWQANPGSVTLDEKRITTKGRIGIRYEAIFGGNLNNEIEVTTYGLINFFECAASNYRIINRYGLGLNARYVNKSLIGSRHNEFSAGGDLFTQPARTEYYENIGGVKSDQIEQVTSEDNSNKGIYISDYFEILKEKMFVLLTGRYDNVAYNLAEETLPSRADKKSFNTITPKLALSYKLNPGTALYTSFGWGFDVPAAGELSSPDQVFLFNRDLNPQESENFELGIKGSLPWREKAFGKRFTYEATFFNVRLTNEIVPYGIPGNIYYRNAAKTNRLGVELGAQLEIVDGLNLGAMYTWSHFKYLVYEAKTFETDSTGMVVESDKNFSGNVEPSVPRNNVYIFLAYSRPVNRHLSLYARATCQGISSLWVDDENTDKTNSCYLLNGILGVQLKFGKFNIMASGGANNIFNERYVGFTNTNSADKRFYEAGAPRNYYVSLNLGYNF